MRNKLTIFTGVSLLAIFFNPISIKAQGTTDSPASMFGLGELVNNETGRYSGMGGVGIALRSDNFLNTNNPAALTAVDTCKFVWEMGLHGKYDKYDSGSQNSTAFEGNISNIALGFSLRKVSFALGLAPYSSMGYAITETKSVEGTANSTTSSLFEGDGGTSKIYFSVAYKLFKNLSVGATMNYLLGHTVETEAMDATTVQTTSRKNAFFADFGAQYTMLIDKKQAFTFGLVYGYKQIIQQHNKLVVADSNSGDGSTQNGVHKKEQIIPQYFGGGIAWTKERLTLTADYRRIQWSPMPADVVTFVNQDKVNVGGDYLFGNLYKEPAHIMAGLGYENSYMMKNGCNPKTYSVSAGVGLPVLNKNLLSLGVKYSIQPTSPQKFQRTNSFCVFLNISFHEKSMRYKIE